MLLHPVEMSLVTASIFLMGHGIDEGGGFDGGIEEDRVVQVESVSEI